MSYFYIFLQTTLNSNLKIIENLFYRQKKFVKEDKCRVIHKSMLNLFSLIYNLKTYFSYFTNDQLFGVNPNNNSNETKWERNMEWTDDFAERKVNLIHFQYVIRIWNVINLNFKLIFFKLNVVISFSTKVCLRLNYVFMRLLGKVISSVDCYRHF